LALSPIFRTTLEARKASAATSTSSVGRRREVAGDGLDCVAAVEVGGMDGHSFAQLLDREAGNRHCLASQRLLQDLGTEADLGGFGLPALARSLLVKPFSLALRVVRVATWRARAEASAPTASMICWRRVENSRRCSSAKPAISAIPSLVHLLPAHPEALPQLVAEVGFGDVGGGFLA
jgi:hypothetical protein